MSADEPEFEGVEVFERELAALRPAKPSLGVEDVIGLRLNEELEAAFVEALRGMPLPRASLRLEAGLERDLAWEFRLEDQLRGLPLRRPTVALGRAVEVQVNLRALRADEVVVPFAGAPRVGESAREKGGRVSGWVFRWGIAAALVVGGFGAGWKMAREAARELRGGIIAGRFESEAARATARMAVGGGWEPAGVPLPQGVGDGSDVVEPSLASGSAVSPGLKNPLGGVPSEGDLRARHPERSSVHPAGGGLARGIGGTTGSSARGEDERREILDASTRAGGGRGELAGSREAEETVGSFVISGRLAARLASANVASANTVSTNAAAVGSDGGRLPAANPPISLNSAGGAAGVVSGNLAAASPIAAVSSLGSGHRVMEPRALVGDVRGEEVAPRSGSRILDAVGQGDLAKVIPVEILNVVEGGVALRELRTLGDVELPVKARFKEGDGGESPLGFETSSVGDLTLLTQENTQTQIFSGERSKSLARSGEVDHGFLREGQLVYVADDDELKMEIGKGFSGGLVARFERLDGHFLAADEVRSASDLERLAHRAKGVLGFLPGAGEERQGPIFPAALMGLPTGPSVK